MNNKVVAIKENKLGFKGWLVKNTLNGSLHLNNIALAMLPKLTKEQALALLKQSTYKYTIFNKLNKDLRNDIEVVISALSNNGGLQIFRLAGLHAKNNTDVVLAALNRKPYQYFYEKDTFEIFNLSGQNAKNNKEVVKTALSKVSDSAIFEIMSQAKFDAWSDKDLVTLALSKASGLADAKKVMGLAKFDAWSDKDLVTLALSKVSGLADAKKVMGLAKFDAWSDKDLVTLALSKVSGLADTKEIMGLAKFDAWNDKKLVIVAINRVSGLADIKEIMNLAKFDAWNNKEFIALVTNLFCVKHSDLFITKFINQNSYQKIDNPKEVWDSGQMASSNESGGPGQWVTTGDISWVTEITYGFDEAKADEFLKGFPQKVIDEVKKQLANKTRTETTTN